jgi:hypothetical protein
VVVGQRSNGKSRIDYHVKTFTKTIGTARNRGAVTALLASSLAMVLALFSNLSWGDEPAPAAKPGPVVEPAPGKPPTNPAPESARKNLKLPGLVADFQKRCVDLEASICLDRGFLELIACTKGSKEHESIVAIEAKPMHIHAALLLLGANPGNPAMRRPIDEQGSRWIDIPPKGDPVDVYLVFKDKEGQTVEHPISRFVARPEKGPEEKPDAGGADADERTGFPHTFLFAGSLLRGNGQGPRRYLSDLSGNVISIATFGDELLCLPGVYSNANESLMWQVDATELPKVGSKVTLRLRPQVKPASKTGKALPGDGLRGPGQRNSNRTR